MNITIAPHEWWVLLTAIICAVACAIPGAFLVLRRASMLGDAISHAILPGLALGFIVSGTRDLFPMLVGATAVGLLTALLTSWLARLGKVPEDAAMGVVFTSLFALGVLMISQVADSVDLDPGCVLYGLIDLTPFDTWSIFGLDLPRAFVTLSVTLLLNAALATLFFKELKIASFDPHLATTMGISAALVHYGLMGSVAVTSVASFEAVGSILVVAMLIAPGATAQFFTDRLSRMVWLACLFAATSAAIGYALALWLNTYVAGMIATTAGAQFALAALFAPRHGFLAGQARQLRLALRIRREDILGVLYRDHEGVAPPRVQAHQLAQGPVGRIATRVLRRRGLISGPRSALSLTPRGVEAARKLVGTHRLWESFLAVDVGLPADHTHDPSERAEHFIPAPVREDLSRRFGGAEDPQGKKIPGDNP